MFDSDFAKTLLERMGGNSATVVIDSEGICVFANSHVHNVLNQTPEDLHQKSFADALTILTLEGDVVLPEKHPVMRALESREFVQTTPFFCKLPDSEETFALTTIPIHNAGGKTDFVVVQIRKAKREVQVGEMKSLFVSFAAHQLKTPSSVVKGFLELMLRQGESAYSKDQWHFLTSAFESNENLIVVSKTLLNMARLEGGLIEPDIRSFDPHATLHAKIASYASVYEAKKLKITLAGVDSDSELNLNSDESFFTEVFGILLGNAIKHSPNESEILVTYTLLKDKCEVHVIDQGSGIAPAIREKLFKKGQDTSDEDENSHGLGLFMAKKYISLLGGTIGLAERDAEATGSDFYFSVPNLS